MKLISINDLGKKYFSLTNEYTALENITFDIYENEIITIVGPSGCGKSTLLNIIGSLENNTSGIIKYYRNLNIGYMVQSDVTFPWLTVYDNAILGLKLQHKLTQENIDYTISLLKKYNLYNFKDNYPKELSGGMKQRLALIRVLATKPNILLLDEPFSKLDVKTKKIINDDIYKIIRDLKITAILVSHDIEDAVIMSDRIIVLSSSPGIKKIIKVNNSPFLPSEKNNTYYNKLISQIKELIYED